MTRDIAEFMSIQDLRVALQTELNQTDPSSELGILWREYAGRGGELR